MKLCLISDTHENHDKVVIPSCDVLVHAGDFSMMGEPKRIYRFLEWFASRPAKRFVLIAGNHDLSLDPSHIGSKHGVLTPIIETVIAELGIDYLNESSVNIDGVSFYGMPYTPSYGNWAFMEPEPSLKERYAKIPPCDVLISHGPPFGIQDESRGEHAGSIELRNRILELKPKICVFGHIHEGYGYVMTTRHTTFLNASVCNSRYQVVNRPWEVEL